MCTSSELGRTTWAAMRIDTGDAAPIVTPAYRMPKAERDVLDEEISRMLADGIIEPNTDRCLVFAFDGGYKERRGSHDAGLPAHQ